MAFDRFCAWLDRQLTALKSAQGMYPTFHLPAGLAELDRELLPPLRLPVTFRAYENRDFDVLLKIYDLNAPNRFPENHREHFVNHLRSGPGGILVGELEGRVICTGGLSQCGPCLYALCYGLIHPEYQRQGIGTAMALLRLGATAEGESATIHYAVIFAVPTSISFYQRLGFTEGWSWLTLRGKKYPSGAMAYTVTTARRVAAGLAERGMVIQGGFEPHREIVWEIQEEVNEVGERVLRLEPKR